MLIHSVPAICRCVKVCSLWARLLFAQSGNLHLPVMCDGPCMSARSRRADALCGLASTRGCIRFIIAASCPAAFLSPPSTFHHSRIATFSAPRWMLCVRVGPPWLRLSLLLEGNGSPCCITLARFGWHLGVGCSDCNNYHGENSRLIRRSHR